MLKLSIFLLTFCVLLSEIVNVQGQYCAAGLCPKGGRHIGCRNSGRFLPSCPGNAKMIPIGRFKNQILHLHNSKRNLIASGRVRGYQPARRMATMQWDNELSALAALNVKQCQMKHDKCRNTRRFRRAGQNLAMYSYTGPIKSTSNSFLVNNRVNAWWREYSNCNMRYIRRYPANYRGPPIGHFTAFVNEKSIRIGCAAARYTRGRKHHFLIACNYASTNVQGEPVYRPGRAASGCRTGPNPRYRFLCSEREPYADL